MAAGEGRRLRPLTDRWPKPILPIDGRPVVATLLREVAASGITRAYVVTGYLAEQIETLLGDGSGFGLDVHYVRQPRADGSADTLRRALAAGAEKPALVVAADTVFTRGDIARFMAAAEGADAAIAVRREPLPSGPGRTRVRVVDGKVERVLDDDPANPFGGAPLWFIGPRIVPLLDGLRGPPYELAVALQRGIDSGLTIAGIEIGKTRDLTYPIDLVEENFPYLGSA
jgi:NDP-sugar pyrophosphorylase family protein